MSSIIYIQNRIKNKVVHYSKHVFISEKLLLKIVNEIYEPAIDMGKFSK